VDVLHRGAEATVPEEFLDGSYVVAIFNQVRREGVAERVTADTLDDAGAPACSQDRLADGGGRAMVTASDAGPGIRGRPGRRKEIKPGPLRRCHAVFSREGMGQRYGEVSGLAVAFEGATRIFQLASDIWDGAFGEDRDAIPVSFPAAYDEPPVLHVEVFHPKSEGFGDAESSTVEKEGDTAVPPVHLFEESPHFVAGENGRNVL